MQNKNGLKIKIFLVIIVFAICIWIRFAFLGQQGFVDSDEYSIYRTFSDNFLGRSIPALDVGSPAWNILGRPFAFISTWFLLLVSGNNPSIVLYYSAFFGVLTVFIIYLIGERHIGKNAGLFASALMSTIFIVVFFSRHMKLMSVGWFFCAIALWFFFKAEKFPRIYNYYFCGLALGLAATTHPNNLVFVALMFLLVTITVAVKIFKLSLWRDRIAIVGKAFFCPLGILVPMIASEVFFLMCKSFLKFNIGKSGYFSATFLGIFAPERMRGPSPSSLPGIGFYLKSVAINGHIFLWLIILSGLLLIISSDRLKKYGFYIIILFWANIAILGLSKTPFANSRNIVPSLLPACLICGAGLSGLVNWAESKNIGIFKYLLLPLLVIAVLIYGLSGSFTCVRNTSAAQQIHDYIQVDRASLTRPGKPVYHWEHYYFSDTELSSDTWSDVFRNYLSRRAEHLVQLIPDWTAAKELLDPEYGPTRKYRNLWETKTEVYFAVFDLNRERRIFSEEFDFNRIAQADVPSEVFLKSSNSSFLSNDVGNSLVQYEMNPPQGANLLLINGRLPLHKKDNFLFVALGDYVNINKFSIEIFQARPSQTSIHTVLRLIEPVPKNIVLSLIYIEDTNKLVDKQIKLSNFEISFYNLPAEHLALAKECPIITDK